LKMDNEAAEHSSQSLEDFSLTAMDIEMMIGRRLEAEFATGNASDGQHLPEAKQDTAGYLPVDRDCLEIGLANCLNGTSSEDLSYKSIMLNYAFETSDYMQRLEELYMGKEQSKGPCRRVIQSKKGYCYRCLDCQKNNSSVICQQCFDKSNHKGHR
jgi:Putative zinc finger in N-recognin (UBR box)